MSSGPHIAYRWAEPPSDNRIAAWGLLAHTSPDSAARYQLHAASLLSSWVTADTLLESAPENAHSGVLNALRIWDAAGDLELEFRDAAHVPVFRLRHVGGAGLIGMTGFEGRARLSRFAVLRQHEHALVVEHPARNVFLRCLDPRMEMLVARLGSGADATAGELLGLDADSVGMVLAILVEYGVCLAVASDDSTAEEHDEALRPWTWHDMAHHFRSRAGKRAAPRLPKFPLLGVQPPEPALKPPMSDDVVALPVPDLGVISRDDIALTEAIEQRRSIREFGPYVLTIVDLGELLFRTSRVRAASPATSQTPYETTNRPYPTAGACYELEIYLTVRECLDLAPGFYRYLPDTHELERISPPSRETEEQLSMAGTSMGASVPPQVLITIASRFARAGWKYPDIAYANTLRNVGVLYQTMWLVSTAMGIGCCALGDGNWQLFAKLTGLDPMIESNVGELCIGRRGD